MSFGFNDDKIKLIIAIFLFIIIGVVFYVIYNKYDSFSGSLTDNNEVINTLNEQQTPPTINETINNLDDNINYYETKTDDNYNTVNNLPYLITPDNPNTGYYFTKTKIVYNKDSPLLKKENDYFNKTCEACNKSIEANNITGYNGYVNLKTDSYANITSIGKSLLTPFVSYPVPS
jgi:hypothetical protein